MAFMLLRATSSNAPKLLWQATLIPGGVQSGTIPPPKLTLYGSDALLASGLFFDPIIYGFDGRVRWQFTTPHRGTATCTAVSSDGRLYVGTTKNELFAFDPKGNLSWVFPATGTKVWSCFPAVGPDGTIYVTASDGVIYAVTPEGKQKWRVEIQSLSGRLAPVVGPDGTVYAATRNLELVAIDSADGREKWRTPRRSASIWTPVCVGNLVICNRGLHGVVNAFEKDGTLAWTYDAQAKLDKETMVGEDGTVYVVAEAPLSSGSTQSTALPPSDILAIGMDGKLRWKYRTTGSAPFPSLGETAGGNLIVNEPAPQGAGFLSPSDLMQYLSYYLGGHFYSGVTVLDPEGRVKRRFELPILFLTYTPITLPGNKMLFLGEDGVLRCYQF